MDEIREKIDELEEGYNYFLVYDQDNEVYFQTYGIQLPIKVPYYTRPQGLTALSDVEKFRKYRMNAVEYTDMLDSGSMVDDIKAVFINAIKMKHKRAYDAATKQVSLSAAGMKIPDDPDPPKEELNIPRFVEMKIETPKIKAITGEQKISAKNVETIAPVFRIKFTMMVEISDDISDVLWGMEYVNYLDKNMDDILAIFERSRAGQSLQRTIHKIHKGYMENLLNIMKENKKEIKIKILK